ncbi:dihydrodipicolinate synthase family protein [Pseudorhodoplanes sp.]|uniref:dihydrodipicolinate synthase family protein n=1 Tax=Pseudorhodoplanes sp. TaxID=1934341 RepID=UPI002CF5DC5C|nr:dihydrodipicolinate synthase family protein [Pseudorhodoplanes sp.]HWV55499.1 dihydrodipicolinate synthase family protein [Pseudorhodoplanes sp.]
MRVRRDRLSAADVTGAWAILPTPALDGASDWRNDNTVNLDETARAVDALIKAGVNGILTLGTFGECATLTWDEKRAFMATCAEAARGRVPVFGGTTSLNTRESIRQTAAAFDLGLDGTMLGPPMWCQVDLPTAIQFYRDVAEACPEMAICVYANPAAFKFMFPRPFWEQVAQIPQVIACKYLGIGMLLNDLAVTKNRIRFLPIDVDYYGAARMAPDACTAFWTSCAVNGPATVIRLRDTVAEAKQTGDWSNAKEVTDAMRAAEAGFFPNGDFNEFSKYNISLEKERMNAAGWMNAGPCRPPYHLAPESFLEGARRSGRAWAALHERYSKVRSRVAANG